MPWFKIDDSLYDHPKFAGLSLAAIGLWTAGGSYCARHLTDGFLSDAATPMLRVGSVRCRADLVAAGLWAESGGGIQYHDWLDFQPSRETVLAERRAAAERQHRARESAKSRRESRDSHGVTHGEVTEQSRRESRSPRPDPTRPVVPTELPTTLAPRKRGTRIPDNFTITPPMRAWAQANAPRITDNLDSATAEFVDYWQSVAGAKAVKLDWEATWRVRMRQVDERRGQVRALRPESPRAGRTDLPEAWR